MRRLILIAAAVALAAATGYAQATAPAAGKIMTTWTCQPPNPMHAVPVGDEPNHAYIVEQGKCTARKGEIAGIAQKEGTFTEFADAMGENAKGHGVFVETLSNGDKVVYTYEFTGTTVNKVSTGKNKWTIKSGTGKVSGIKGSGTCTGKGPEGAAATYTCTGSYTIGK